MNTMNICCGCSGNHYIPLLYGFYDHVMKRLERLFDHKRFCWDITAYDILDSEFYEGDTVRLARSLLGPSWFISHLPVLLRLYRGN